MTQDIANIDEKLQAEVEFWKAKTREWELAYQRLWNDGDTSVARKLRDENHKLKEILRGVRELVKGKHL